MGAEAGQGVTVEGPSVRIRPALVQTLALAIHELATNARKHGALSSSEGTLDVTWQLRDPKGECRLFIEWREEGLSRDRITAANGGYGQQLIERALPYTLGAETSFRLPPGGFSCTIDLPLD